MEAGLRKLLKLKDWVSVPDAARHLSIILDVIVSEADVLRFALDGRLTLSVYFVNPTWARCANIVSGAENSNAEISTKNRKAVVGTTINGFKLRDGRVAKHEGGITFIDGLWDLSMIEAGRVEIEKKYQLLTGGPTVDDCIFERSLLNRADGTWAQLFEPRRQDEKDPQLSYDHPRNYLPLNALPSDAVFVVRTSVLRDLECLLSDAENASERPIGQRERTTLLVIIAALAELARIKVERPSAAAAAIESQAALMGVHVGMRTIEEKLKLIPEALRSKADT